MVRVLPLFIHTMLRDEPVTVFGQEKTLDFTYVDDCIDGITRGIEALAEGRVVNETINLAYGHGNSLVHAAELIAAELGVEPKIALAPSLPRRGHALRRRPDERRASCSATSPPVPLEEGIPVRWRGSRSTALRTPRKTGRSPADVLFPQDADIGWKSGPAVSSSSVVAIFRPDRVGQDARSPKRSQIVSTARCCRRTRCRRIEACRSSRLSRSVRRGLSGSGLCTHEGSVAEYAQLRTLRSTSSWRRAHARGDRRYRPVSPRGAGGARAASCAEPGAAGPVGTALRPSRAGARVRRPGAARSGHGGAAASATTDGASSGRSSSPSSAPRCDRLPTGCGPPTTRRPTSIFGPRRSPRRR